MLLHGFSMEHRFMTHAYEPIFTARAGAGAGWRRIYPDMPGHGATPAPVTSALVPGSRTAGEFADGIAYIVSGLKTFVETGAPLVLV